MTQTQYCELSESPPLMLVALVVIKFMPGQSLVCTIVLRGTLGALDADNNNDNNKDNNDYCDGDDDDNGGI